MLTDKDYEAMIAKYPYLKGTYEADRRDRDIALLLVEATADDSKHHQESLDAGEWELVGANLLKRALKNQIPLPQDLVREAATRFSGLLRMSGYTTKQIVDGIPPA